MTQTQSTKPDTARGGPASEEPLAHIRAAAQELHGAISDAAVKRGHEIKEHLEALPPKAAELVVAIKGALATQNEVAKQHLTEVVKHLEAVQTQIAAGLKSSGHIFETAVRQALADSRSAVQKVSEVVAATRSAQSTQQTQA